MRPTVRSFFFFLSFLLPVLSQGATLDDFSDAKKFSVAPNSMGQASVDEAAGLSGTGGLVFAHAAGTGRITAVWRAALNPEDGFTLMARTDQPGAASLQVKFVEKDGDGWVQWFAPTSDWQKFGAAFTDLEFVPSGDGMRNTKAIVRLEITAVLQGGAGAKCIIDDLETTTGRDAHPFAIQPEYNKTLREQLDQLPLEDPQALHALQSQLDAAAESEPDAQLTILKQGLARLLPSVLHQANASRIPSSIDLQSVEARTASRLSQQSQFYIQRLQQLATRAANYRLDNRETEESVLYSLRVLQMLRMAQDLHVSTMNMTPSSSPAAANQSPARRERMTLNGPWAYTTASSFSGTVTLPLPWGHQGELSRGVTLTRSISIPSEWAGRRVVLHADGAGHFAEVFVNGRYYGSHIGGFDPFDIDLTPALRFGQSCDLRLVLEPSAATAVADVNPHIDVDVYPRIQPGPGPNAYLTMGGIDGANAGVWGDLYLETRPAIYMDSVGIDTDLAARKLSVHVAIENSSSQVQSVELAAQVPGINLSMQQSAITIAPQQRKLVELSTSWAPARARNGALLWEATSPKPALYPLQLSLRANGSAIDQRTVRFGFRECEFSGNQFQLNGKAIRLIGQTAPAYGNDTARIRQFLEAARKGGVNLIRLPAGSSMAWLDACDEMGLLCAAESPIHGMVGVAPPDLFGLDNYSDPLWRANAAQQMANWAQGQANHPSLAFRISETGAFGGDRFWAHGGGVPSQARKLRAALDAAFAFDAAIRTVDSSTPIVHLDNGYADGDPRFAVCAWPAPFAAEDWSRHSAGRPIIAEIIPPASARLQTALVLRTWTNEVLKNLESQNIAAVFLPEARAPMPASTTQTTRPNL